MNLNTEHKSTALKLLVSSAVALGAAGVGLLINVTLLQNCFSFSNWGTRIHWAEWSLARMEKAVNAILAAFGWHADGAVYSVTTFGNVVAVIILVLLVVAAVDIMQNRKGYGVGSVVLTLFTLSGLVVISGIYLTTTMTVDLRFTLPITIFVLPVIAFYLTQHWQWRVVVKKLTVYVKPVLAVVALTLVLVNGALISSQFYFANAYPWHVPASNASLWQIGEQLLAAGYGQGYYLGKTECWTGGNALTEMTNGQIEVWHLRYGAETIDDVYHWLQPTAHATEYPTGKIFLIVDCERWYDPLPQKIAADAQATEHTYYADDNFIVYVYNSVDALVTVLREATVDAGGKSLL